MWPDITACEKTNNAEINLGFNCNCKRGHKKHIFTNMDNKVYRSLFIC